MCVWCGAKVEALFGLHIGNLPLLRSADLGSLFDCKDSWHSFWDGWDGATDKHKINDRIAEVSPGNSFSIPIASRQIAG